MESRFLESMQKLGFPCEGKTILVAVSGGVDSMVLVSLLLKSGYQIAVAHCNYQLRGADSDADEELVRTWCTERNIPFHLKRVETQKLTELSNSSIQMVAREERYRFFEALMDEHDYAATALAHHADDRVETLLMNVLRGTGFRGFQGIPSKRDSYIRPLLEFTKDEILAFAKQENVPFRDDGSNQKADYQRNWIRLRVLPMLKKIDDNAFQKLLQFCERAEKESPNYEGWVRKKLDEVSNTERISVKELEDLKAPFTLLKELLEPKGFSSNHVFEVLELLDSNSGKEVSTSSHRVTKDRDELLISELNQDENPPKFQFEILKRNRVTSLKTGSHVVLLDAYKINQLELKVRKWRQGDKFKPLGMQGWKLLSDFFIDKKLSVPEKERTWLLTHEGNIVWVVGHRMDDRFKVTPNTQKVLKVIAKP